MSDQTQIAKLLKSADICCTTTASHEPLFNSDIQANLEGCHFNSVGSFTKDMCELPKSLITQMNPKNIVLDTVEGICVCFFVCLFVYVIAIIRLGLCVCLFVCLCYCYN